MSPSRQHRHLASVDGSGRPSGEATKAVILAGGRGTRLAPYTSILPKPLMPIGDRSILETVVEQLGRHGFSDITFCVGYLSHLIRAVFDTRELDDVQIRYVQEEHALGTAAPLRLVDGLDETFVMMNGDVLTTLDYRDLVAQHTAAGNVLTVATRKRLIKIDYGVVHVDEEANPGFGVISDWEEKPEIVSTVSMGVYALEPAALAYIPADGYFDLPDLVRTLMAAGEQVGVYRHDGLWFDIGRQEDYQEAVATWLEAQETEPVDVHANGHVNGHAGAQAAGKATAAGRRVRRAQAGAGKLAR